MGDDRLEHVAHVEVVRVALVVKDVAARDRGARQMPHEHFVAERQIAEAVRVELHDRGFVDALEEVLPLGSSFGNGSCQFLHRVNPIILHSEINLNSEI